MKLSSLHLKFKNMLWNCFPAVLLLAFNVRESRCQGNTAAMVISVSDKGFEFIVQAGLNYLKKSISEAELPPNNGTVDSFLGAVKYHLKKGKVTHLVLGPSSVVVNPKDGVEVVIRGVDLNASSEYSFSYSKFFIAMSDSGKVVATVRNATLTFSTLLIKTPEGSFNMKQALCGTKIGKMDLVITGSMTSFYSIITYFAMGPLQRAIMNALCEKVIEGMYGEGNTRMSKWNTTMKINKILTINYKLISDPVHKMRYMEIRMFGRFLNDPIIEYAPATMMPLLAGMVDVCISEVTLNSGLRVGYRNLTKSFETNITNPRLANFVRHSLKGPSKETSSGMGLHLILTIPKTPTVSMSSQGIVLNSRLELGINMLMSKGIKETINTIRLDAAITLDPMISDNVFFCVIKEVKVNVESIAINSTKSAKMTKILSELIELFLPNVNNFLREGFALPSVNDFRFTLVKSQVYSRYVAMSVNLSNGKPK